MACNGSPIVDFGLPLRSEYGFATVQTVRSSIARVAASLEAVLWDGSIVAACGAAALGIFSDLSLHVGMLQHLGKIAHVDEHAEDRAIAEMIEFRLGNAISLF